MKVLFLGSQDSALIPILKKNDDQILWIDRPIDAAFRNQNPADFLISYGYHHILKTEVLEFFPGRAVNLHISYLPWNRGADPNLWSFVDNTPKGVSIHHIDCGIDTGDLIARQEVTMDGTETLRSSYEKLNVAMLDLFEKVWPDICAGRAARTPQQGRGSFHKVSDRARVESLLTQGWDTPVSRLQISSGQ